MKWLLLLVAAAPVFAQCNYSVSQTAFNIPATGLPSGQITVTTAAGCQWQFATDSSWISFLGQAPDSNGKYPVQSGPGVLNFAAAPSTFPIARQAIIQIATPGSPINIIINEAAANCTMTLNPATANIGVSGGNGTFQVQTACTWAAQSETSWITIGATGNFTGNGSVGYTAAANPCADGRTGFVAVAAQPNQIFTLTQSGADSNLAASPSSLTAPVGGTAGVISILTGPGCGWSAFADVNFIHFTSVTSGTGVGTLGYRIDANTGVARTGYIHIGSNLLVPVSQPAAVAPAPVIAGIGNAASGTTGAVAPGEIISIFGTGMGPTPGVGLQVSNGSVTTNLSGVQVLFDNVPAPLLYVSAAQINTVVPYRVASNPSTQVTVSYGGGTSTATTLQIMPTAPAIFTQDASGRGIGAILNQNYSVNARLNPAARGSVIAIYMTGAGFTTPASADGSVTPSMPPFPALSQTPTVTIGGVTVAASDVLYSGAAPSAIAGFTQIDVIVPQSVTPGPTTSITVTIGGVTTQANVTLSVQ